jgi:anti-anti-sigma factor
MKELEITQQASASGVILRVVGSVDSTTAPELQAAVLQATAAPSGSVELNLAEVSFLSSAGLRALLMGSKALQKRGERLTVSNVPPHIYNILNLTGFTSFIDVKA